MFLRDRFDSYTSYLLEKAVNIIVSGFLETHPVFMSSNCFIEQIHNTTTVFLENGKGTTKLKNISKLSPEIAFKVVEIAKNNNMIQKDKAVCIKNILGKKKTIFIGDDKAFVATSENIRGIINKSDGNIIINHEKANNFFSTPKKNLAIRRKPELAISAISYKNMNWILDNFKNLYSVQNNLEDCETFDMYLALEQRYMLGREKNGQIITDISDMLISTYREDVNNFSVKHTINDILKDKDLVKNMSISLQENSEEPMDSNLKDSKSSSIALIQNSYSFNIK